MKKIKLIFSLLLIVTLLISPINVLAVTTGEDNGTPSANISSTPNAESNYTFNSYNTSIKWIEKYDITGNKINISFPGIYNPGKPFYNRTNFDSSIVGSRNVNFYAFLVLERPSRNGASFNDKLSICINKSLFNFHDGVLHIIPILGILLNIPIRHSFIKSFYKVCSFTL